MSSHKFKIIGIFVLVIALTVTLGACDVGDDPEPTMYELTIGVDGEGTTDPEPGTHEYEEDAIVNIEATADVGWEFIEWEGDLESNEAEETVIMDEDKDITAVFEEKEEEEKPLDHFKSYFIEAMPHTVGESVHLEDQFLDSFEAEVTDARYFANPVVKTHDDQITEIGNPDHHLMFYEIEHDQTPQERLVEVDNQFGEQVLTVSNPVRLAVPTHKEEVEGEPTDHNPPEGLDHFLVYEAEGEAVNANVQLQDQFASEQTEVLQPVAFANPVVKTHNGEVTEIENPDEHLVFYEIEENVLDPMPWVDVENQFVEHEIIPHWSVTIGVPSK